MISKLASSIRPRIYPDVQVIKVGGSLLNDPNLIDRLIEWESNSSTRCNLYLVGGGELVREIRRLEKVFRFGDAFGHQLCLRAMSFNLRGIHLSSGWPIISAHDAIEGCIPKCALVDCYDWPPAYQDSSWETTSDSLSARFADAIHAEQLVLLKSCSPSDSSLSRWVASEFVDASFPRFVSSGLQVMAVNFRSDVMTRVKMI